MFTIIAVVASLLAAVALVVALRLNNKVTQSTTLSGEVAAVLVEVKKQLEAAKAEALGDSTKQAESTRLLAADTTSQALKLEALIASNLVAIERLGQHAQDQQASIAKHHEQIVELQGQMTALQTQVSGLQLQVDSDAADIIARLNSVNTTLHNEITAVRMATENVAVQFAALGLKGKELSEAALMMATASGNLPVLLTAAVEEQVRRESEHPIQYTEAQRILAIQQRLSRALGSKAFSPELLELIQNRVHAHAILGK